MPLHSDFVIARMLIKNGSAFFVVFFQTVFDDLCHKSIGEV